jgi:chorismate mutase-like protein
VQPGGDYILRGCRAAVNSGKTALTQRSSSTVTLEEARIAIDGIDKELLRLLNERAHFVNVIGEIKHREGLEIYAPEREEKLLRKLVELNAAQQGKLPEKSIRAIYREIMSAALAMEHPLRIAYLGAPGTRTHQVALNKFGHGVFYVSHDEPKTMFASVADQEADYALLPMEEARDGTVYHATDYLADTNLQVCAQVNVSTGGSSVARHLILGRRASPPTGEDSTLLLLDVPDRVGALQEVLATFVAHQINVRSLENRPAPLAEPPKARFVVEVAGHAQEPQVSAALEALRQVGFAPKWLGSYPASAWVEALG